MEWSLSLLEVYDFYALFTERCSIFLHGLQTFNPYPTNVENRVSS